MMNTIGERLRALAEASRELSRQDSKEATLERAAPLAASLMTPVEGALYLHDQGKGWRVFGTSVPQSTDSWPNLIEVPAIDSRPQRCETSVHALITAPLRSGEKLCGALVLRRPASAGFTTEESDLLETFALETALKLDALGFKGEEIGSTEATIAEEWAAGIAHAVRARLGHIQGFTTKLERRLTGGWDIATAKRDLQIIFGSAADLLRLTETLIGFLKLRVAVLRPGSVDCEALAADTIAKIRSERELPNTEFHVGRIPSLHADPALLSAVFLELLRNAVKFTSKRASARIEVGSTDLSGDTTTIYIRDNGVGFDPTYGHKLFKPFERLHPGKEYEGFGLGLACAKMLIEHLGGSIRAEGAPDQGMTVYFSLARARATAEATVWAR
jgi:signal transduction histidine kinase